MPCLWLQHNNSQLFINVGIIDASAVNLSASPIVGASLAAPRMFVALVDTGAERTMISTNVVNTLGLKPQGSILVHGVGPTPTPHNGYLFHVAFTIPIIVPGRPGASPTGPQQLMVFIHPVPIYGAELPVPRGFDVLLVW
jgi:hypothetical protein